jgi:hypothetical protein
MFAGGTLKCEGSIVSAEQGGLMGTLGTGKKRDREKVKKGKGKSKKAAMTRREAKGKGQKSGPRHQGRRRDRPDAAEKR